MHASNLPLTQQQASYFGVALIVIVVIVNTINFVALQYKINKINRDLLEISKQILIQSGYLKEFRSDKS